MQLTDEPDKRCYPLESSLLCHTCHLRRLGISPDDSVSMQPVAVTSQNISTYGGGRNQGGPGVLPGGDHYPPPPPSLSSHGGLTPPPAYPSPPGSQSGYADPRDLYRGSLGTNGYHSRQGAPSPSYSHSGSESSYAHLPGYPSPMKNSSMNTSKDYQITDL